MRRLVLINYLEQRFGVKHTHPDFRFRSFLLSALILISLTLVFFVYYNIFIDFFVPMLVANLIALIFCLMGGYYLLVQKQPKIAAIVLQLIVSIDSFFLILISGNEEFALVFAFLTPVMGIFLLGYRWGAILSIINFAAIFYFCFTQMETWGPVPFDTASLIHFSVIYLVILIVSFFYDSSRRKAYQMMEEANVQLQELATTDVLTKLRNRRYLEDRLLGTNTRQYMAMIDVDNFKQVNDLLGHDQGDKVLIELANLLKETVSSNDIIGRWGGEEFVILFAERDITQLQASLEKLNQAVANHDFGIDRKVTISMGLSDHSATCHRDSLRTVDQALYNAKANGKNRYCIMTEAT